MTHGVTANRDALTLARLVGEISTVQSLPLIPSDYALTISPAGTALPADIQIFSKPAPAAPTSAPALFDTAVVHAAPGSRLELAA